MDFTFKECLAITLVRSDKKITIVQHAKSQLRVLFPDFHLVCIKNVYDVYIVINHGVELKEKASPSI